HEHPAAPVRQGAAGAGADGLRLPKPAGPALPGPHRPGTPPARRCHLKGTITPARPTTAELGRWAAEACHAAHVISIRTAELRLLYLQARLWWLWAERDREIRAAGRGRGEG